MKKVFRITSGVSALFFSIFLLGNAPVENDKDGKCCYTNSPAYQGVCEVTPGEGETCAGILAYLNSPQSAGKSYCNNTKVRGGWKQVDCEEKSERMQCLSNRSGGQSTRLSH